MRLKNKQGFTLVEICIIMAIIGILAAIGIPSLTWTPTRALGSLTRQLWSEIQLARKNAVMKRTKFILYFADGQVQILSKNINAIDKNCNINETTAEKTIPLNNYISSVTINNTFICFNPNGTATPLGSTIVITNIENLPKTITISSSTGTPKIS